MCSSCYQSVVQSKQVFSQISGPQDASSAYQPEQPLRKPVILCNSQHVQHKLVFHLISFSYSEDNHLFSSELLEVGNKTHSPPCSISFFPLQHFWKASKKNYKEDLSHLDQQSYLQNHLCWLYHHNHQVISLCLCVGYFCSVPFFWNQRKR